MYRLGVARRTGDARRQRCVPRNAPQRRSGPDETRGSQANVASRAYRFW